MFGTQLVNLLCNAVHGVCFSEYTIVYEHDRVDKIRVDSMAACAHADILHVGSGL